MRRLLQLQAPACAALARLASRDACGSSLRCGAAAAPSGAACAVRRASGAAVDSSGSAPGGAAAAASAAGAAAVSEHAKLLHAELSRHGQVGEELVQQVLLHEPALAATAAARRAAADRFALLAKVAPGFWKLYAPHVSAMLLAGGPRLFERLVQEMAAGAATIAPRAPSPALVAHLAERNAVTSPGTQIGDCTVTEDAPSRSATQQTLFDAERRLWELEDEEHDDTLASSAALSTEDDSRGSSYAPRRPTRRTYPRGSPPPRTGRSSRRKK